MGAVYSGEHAQIGRKVAIKVLLPELAQNTNIVQRFFNEAKATSAIKHPGIVEIFDFGQTNQGSPYIVMELLQGEALQRRLERELKFPSPVAVGIMRQIASALGAAHAVGIVHRDLKPENIYLLPDAQDPAGVRVKLLDFGIAKLDEELRGDLDPTRAGAILGTPQYMSPEQCTGSTALDRRSDMYALGCVLFHMLCGRPPFVEVEFGQIAIKHLSAAPPKPSVIEPTVSPELEAILLRLLEKQPDDRYQLCDQLIDALDGKQPRAVTSDPMVLPPGARTFVPGEMMMIAKDLPANRPGAAPPLEKPKTAILGKQTPPGGIVAPSATPAASSGPIPTHAPEPKSGRVEESKGLQPIILIAVAAAVLAIFVAVVLLSQ